LVIEIVLTAVFVYVILGVTDIRASKGFAPVAIGLALTLIHLVSIPVTNTSVNPARSIGPALFAGGEAMGQLWLFVVAPVVGALLAGLSYTPLLGRGSRSRPWRPRRRADSSRESPGAGEVRRMPSPHSGVTGSRRTHER
jgi:aquaporin Z